MLKNHILQTTEGELRLEHLQGKYVVLYFYPKDNTSGCTQEAKDFNDALKKLHHVNAVVLGVSRDSLASHKKFKADHDLSFTLISDPDSSCCVAFNVMKEKSMYGKKYMGIERSTFLIDPNGKIIKEWRNVKVPGHVEEVMKFLTQLSN